MIFDNRVLVAADAYERLDTIDMVGSDQQWGSQPVPSTLNHAVKEKCLCGCAVTDRSAERVAVHLRGDDERDVWIAEVAQCALEQMPPRHVVWIQLRHDVVGLPVCGQPRVVIPSFGPCAKRPGGRVELGFASPAEVADSQAPGDRSHLWIVTLIQDPHVYGSLRIFHGAHRRERSGHQGDWLATRDDCCDYRYSEAIYRSCGDGIARVRREHPERGDLQQAHEFNHQDGKNRHSCENATRTGLAERSTPVAGRGQPYEKTTFRERARGDQQQQRPALGPTERRSEADRTFALVP